MKRYVVFAGDDYYPGGGWEDFHFASNDLNEVRAYIAQYASKADWHHLVDLEEGIVIT